MSRLDTFISWARGKGLDVAQSDAPDRMFVSEQTELCYQAVRSARDANSARDEQEPEPLFLGHWHHGEGNLCCGTMRYMRADFDTQPAPEIRAAIFDWICCTMNAATDNWRKQRRAREDDGAPLAPMVRPALQRFATPADANLNPSDFVPAAPPNDGGQ